MPRHVIDHPHNEASAIIAVHNRRLLEAFGFETAFWIACDEARAHKAVALLGRLKEGTDGGGTWHVVRARWKRNKCGDVDAKHTDDCEAMARAGAFIYVFGSQFGAKDGPLDPERHFVARFNESLVAPKHERLKGELEVARAPFLLHRLINDAIAQREVQVLPAGRHVLEDIVRTTIDEGGGGTAAWGGRLRAGDHPINVEGACFLPNGRLLLGLRWPVSAEGHPLLVEVDGIDRLFVDDGLETYGPPEVTRLLSLQDTGTADAPMGVRELDQRGTTVHVIVGDLDHGEDSAIIADHPEGTRAPTEHRTFEWPDDGREAMVSVRSRLVRRFGPDDNVEGFALFEDGTTWYVHDDERVVLDEVRDSRDAKTRTPRDARKADGTDRAPAP